MLELATWTAVVILGPGAIAVFVWFLFDLRKIARHTRRRGRSAE